MLHYTNATFFPYPITKDITYLVDCTDLLGSAHAMAEYIDMHQSEYKFIYVIPDTRSFSDTTKMLNNSFRTHARAKDPYSDFKGDVFKNHNVIVKESVFNQIDDDLLSHIQVSNYILVLERIYNHIVPFTLHPDDLKIILNQSFCHLDEKDFIIWDDDTYPTNTGYFGLEKILSKQKKLTYNKSLNLTFMQTLCMKSFKYFKKVFWLLPNHLYEQEPFLNLYDIEHDYLDVVSEDSVYEHNTSFEMEWKEKLEKTWEQEHEEY